MLSFRQFVENAHVLPHYGAWGWLLPDGKVVDGTETPGVRRHEDLVKRLGMNMRRAIQTGWVKWMQHYNDVELEFSLTDGALSAIKKILKQLSTGKSGVYTARVWKNEDGIESTRVIRATDPSSFVKKIEDLV